MSPRCQHECVRNVAEGLEFLTAGGGRGGGPLTAANPGSRGTRPWRPPPGRAKQIWRKVTSKTRVCQGGQCCGLAGNLFLEKDGDNWVKNTCGNVVEEVLLTFSARGDFVGCTAEEALRFTAAGLLGSHCFEVYWLHRRRSGDGVVNRLRCGR